MTACKHTNLILLPGSARHLRCRHCHLTIKAEELEAGYCPECFEVSGKKHDDFETIASSDQTKYRCEACGAIIEYKAQDG